MIDFETFRHLGGGRKGVFLLLRYVFIIAASYLLIIEVTEHGFRPSHGLMIAAALASNIFLSILSPRALFSWYVEAPVLVADTLWISWALHSTGAIEGEFFLLYFFVLSLAALGENLLTVVVGSLVVSLVNFYVVRDGSASLQPLLLRMTFFFAVALFYGHVLNQIKRERRRADKGFAWARELEAKVAERTQALQTLYEESLAANRAKSEFVANMSHEFRTPLHIIVGYTEMLLDGQNPLDLEEREHLTDRTRAAAVGLLHLVESVLDLRKLESGAVPVVDEAIPLNAFAASVQRRERIAPAPGVELRWEINTSLPVIQTDSSKLTIVLDNLITNALKFTNEGSVTVTVCDIPDAKHVEFRVDDTGPGIGKQDLASIFEPFHQVRSANPEQGGGIGLGLAIVHRYVGLLEGAITAQSTVGRGTSFVVRLPYARSMHESQLQHAA